MLDFMSLRDLFETGHILWLLLITAALRQFFYIQAINLLKASYFYKYLHLGKPSAYARGIFTSIYFLFKAHDVGDEKLTYLLKMASIMDVLIFVFFVGFFAFFLVR